MSSLESYLASLPSRFSYRFSAEAAAHLRRALFFAFSCDGKYLSDFFSYESLPRTWNDVQTPCAESYVLDQKKQHPAHPGVPCLRLFRRNEPCYRCLTCGVDETCALCADCFNSADHVGHEVYLLICLRDIGGVCDCGDAEAWVVHNECTHSKTPQVEEEDIPQDRIDAMLHTFETILDFFVDVLVDTRAPPDGRHYLVLYNDQARHHSDAVKRVRLALMKVPEFAEMVVKRVDKFGRAIVLGLDNKAYLEERKAVLESTGLASEIVTCVDYFRQEMCGEFVSWLAEITRGPVAGNYRLAHRLFCKALCCAWRPGYPVPETPRLRNGRLVVYPVFGDSPPETYWKRPIERERFWDILQDLCDECGYDREDRSLEGTIKGLRFQLLLAFDHKLWRLVRVLLHEIYVLAAVSNIVYKTLMACQYVDIYPLAAEIHLAEDREFDWSFLSSLLVQLFTCPTNATMLSRHGEVKKILAAAYGFLTTGHAVFVDPSARAPVLQSSLKVRRVNQLFFDLGYILQRNEDPPVFFEPDFVRQVCDFTLLLNGVPTTAREAREHVEYEATDYPLYFHGNSIVANFARLVSKSAQQLDDPCSVVVPAIGWVLQAFLERVNTTLEDDTTDLSFVNRFSSVTIGNHTVNVLQFRVDRDAVAFLHPLSAYLSFLIEVAGMQKVEELANVIHSIEAEDLVMENSLEHTMQMMVNRARVFDIMVDYSLRTIVLLSQIKVGFWVRNGLSTRSQFHFYRSWGLRELGFARDMHMVQVLCCLHKNSNFVPGTIVERWQLASFVNQNYTDFSVYESAQCMQFMVEEMLSFFVVMLEFNDHLLGLSESLVNERRLLHELVHALCFKPLAYSELCGELPEHITTDRRLEYLLNKVTDYLPPSGTGSAGRYQLKSEYRAQVNPYYIHYTSNRRDDAERLVRKDQLNLWRKNDPTSDLSYDDTYYEPRKVELCSFYENLFDFTTSPLFVQILRSSVCSALIDQPIESSEILRFALHLIHVCLVNHSGFSSACLDDSDGESLALCVYKVLTCSSLVKHHSKARAVLRAISGVEFYLGQKFAGFKPDHLLSAVEAHALQRDAGASEAELKKQLAAARRAKIMASFKKQQTAFLEQNADTGLDEDIEGELSVGGGWCFPEETCILCQMPAACEKDLFGVVAYVTQSSEFRNVPFDDPYWTAKAFCGPLDLSSGELSQHSDCTKYISEIEEKAVVGPGFPTADPAACFSRPITTSCGHGMHMSCLKTHLQTARKRKTYFTKTLPEDTINGEFICPLCKALSNFLVPVLSYSNGWLLNELLKPSVNWDHALSLPMFELRLTADYQRLYFEERAKQALESVKSRYTSCFVLDDDKSVLPAEDVFEELVKQFFVLRKTLGYVTMAHSQENVPELISHTIASIETSLRGVSAGGGLVFHQLLFSQITTLRVWCDYNRYLGILAAKKQLSSSPEFPCEILSPESLSKARVELQTMDSEKHLGLAVSPEDYCDAIERQLAVLRHLCSDAMYDLRHSFFELLVACTPLQMFEATFGAILRKCYVFEILRSIVILVSKLPNSIDLSRLPEIEDPTQGSCETVVRSVSLSLGIRTSIPPLVFYCALLKAMTPFLRRASIWAFVCAADDESCVVPEDGLPEADRLANFMNLPSVLDILKRFTTRGSPESGIIEGFLLRSAGRTPKLELEFPSRVELISLPKRIDLFFTEYFYPRSNNDLAYDPAVCLFCAQVVEFQGTVIGFRNEFGECNIHCETECINDGLGLFLLPKHGSILMLHRGCGLFYDAPYHDQHGEIPKDNKNTHPLHLSAERYHDFVRNVWLSHNVSNYVTRKLESAVDIGGWESL